MSQEFNKNTIAKKFSQAANQYDSFAHIQTITAQKLTSLIKDHLSPNLTILDLASGSGAIYNQLIKLTPQFKGSFIACDISFEMLKANAKKFSQNHLVNCDFDHLPFAKSSFDLIISSSSLQWSSNLNKVIENSYELLKNNGIFAFALPINGSLSQLRDLSKLANCNFGFNDLPKVNDIKKYLNNLSFSDFEISTEIIDQSFSNPLSAIKSIKGVGANYNSQNTIIKKSDLARFQQIFADSNSRHFTNSWNISFIKAKK